MREPGRRAAADVHGLVRPYMLGEDDPWPPPRNDQYNNPFPPGLLGDATEAGWPADRARHYRTPPVPDSGLPAPRHRAPRRGSLAGWSAALRQRPGPATIGAVAGIIIAIAVALIGFLPASRTSHCAGGRPCHAAAAGLPSLRPGSPAASAHRPAAPVRPSARPSPTPSDTSAPASAAPELTPTPPATTEPAPATPAPARTPPAAGVTVSYKLVRFWNDGFEGKLTIMNGSTAPVDDWQLALVLPGDRVLVAWNAGFSATGATLVLTPHSHQEVIEPGVSLSEHFIASGTHVRPRSCMLNGVPCS